jgi:hypothetical protein
MGKVSRFKGRPTGIGSMQPPAIEAFVYFVGWRVVDLATGQVRERYKSMILTVPGPIRHGSSLKKVEEMILDAELKHAAEDQTPGIKIVGSAPDIRVQITSVSFLEKYLQELTPEEEALIRKRNEEILEAKRKGDAEVQAANPDKADRAN